MRPGVAAEWLVIVVLVCSIALIGGIILFGTKQGDKYMTSAVPGVQRCVRENGEGSGVEFCLDGDVLTICTSDDGCIAFRVQTVTELP